MSTTRPPADDAATGTMADPTAAPAHEVSVCICTFRRPAVAAALDSVARQVLPPGWRLRLVVVDNDDAPSAEAAVREAARRAGVAVDYRHAPGRNISIARNAALDAVATPLMAFLDDDELAAPDWLARLLAAADGAQAVFGPAVARYPAGSPDWAAALDFHSNRMEAGDGPPRSGHTCNALLDVGFVRARGLRFREELGRTGGEDTVFFREVHRAGGVLRYAPDAVVYEDVDPARAALPWVWRRKYRSGQTHGLLLAMEGGGGLRDGAVVSAKIAACFAMAAANVASPHRRLRWAARGMLHLGVMSRLLKRRALVEYG